jgi:lysyl-tRNA synthetase class II
LTKNFHDSKDKLRRLKEKYREEDKRLKEQHKEVQIMKERVRKIRDYVQEKKRIESETGVKQDATEDDIYTINGNIDALEQELKEAGGF